MGNINLVIDNSLLERVDEARGKQPRVSWIRDAISDKLKWSQSKPADDPKPAGEFVPYVRAAEPPSKRHHPTCTCLVCKPT